MTKKCTKCFEEKEMTSEYFYVDNSKSCGYHPRCRVCTKEYMLRTREHRLKVKKEYRKNNKKKIQEYAKPYQKMYREENKEVLRESKRIWKKTKRKEDKIFKIKGRVGRNIRLILSKRGYTKKSKMYKILGIDYDGLYRHLCSSFELNYGIGRAYIDWDLVHIDHRIPQSLAKTEEEVYKLNHYTNLQLLYAEDNFEKSDNTEWKLY